MGLYYTLCSLFSIRFCPFIVCCSEIDILRPSVSLYRQTPCLSQVKKLSFPWAESNSVFICKAKSSLCKDASFVQSKSKTIYDKTNIWILHDRSINHIQYGDQFRTSSFLLLFNRLKHLEKRSILEEFERLRRDFGITTLWEILRDFIWSQKSRHLTSKESNFENTSI